MKCLSLLAGSDNWKSCRICIAGEKNSETSDSQQGILDEIGTILFATNFIDNKSNLDLLSKDEK